jgi:hypothetical protein
LGEDLAGELVQARGGEVGEDGVAEIGGEQEGEERVAASLTQRLRLACEAGGVVCSVV